MRTIIIKCYYCEHDVSQNVFYTLSSFMFNPRLVHGLDGYETSAISECPHCGYVSYYLKEKIPVTTEETIEQINKEYEVISSSIPNDREFSDAD